MAPKPPTPAELTAIVQSLLSAITREIEALKLRLPSGASPTLDQIMALVSDALNAVNPDALKQALFTDLLALIQKGKGPAPHDPTELA